MCACLCFCGVGCTLHALLEYWLGQGFLKTYAIPKAVSSCMSIKLLGRASFAVCKEKWKSVTTHTYTLTYSGHTQKQKSIKVIDPLQKVPTNSVLTIKTHYSTHIKGTVHGRVLTPKSLTSSALSGEPLALKTTDARISASRDTCVAALRIHLFPSSPSFYFGLFPFPPSHVFFSREKFLGQV